MEKRLHDYYELDDEAAAATNLTVMSSLRCLSQDEELRGNEGKSSKLVIAKALSKEAVVIAEPIKMVKAIRVHELGGPEVLKWEDVELGEPKEGEIRIKNKAIGLNFIDIYFRKGVYKAATMPFTPGSEAVGEVTAVGPGLTGRKVGDVVAYAASIMLKGMTAQFLVRRCFKVESGHTVLVHAAAGGVGSLLCQWANALGATVIGAVSTKEKAAQAKKDGCHHVIIYKEEDFVARVNEITAGKGVEVVYDSVGKDTFQGSLECLKPRGYMVSFGQSSGTPDPVPLPALGAKSLFLTRPSLMQYTSTRDELLETAGEVFANVTSGVLRHRHMKTLRIVKHRGQLC
ncbi:hypothetical protein REPUB_Repub07fG0007800 [Reevesia pubescens]